jgi:choline dehydrogenase-like flavoprotein
MAAKRKPERASVCIVGAGASGATAAKVLTEAGVDVVCLDKGPYLRTEDFGGDELANVNRYYLWPDPALNPRTYRNHAGEEAREKLFCPVPQMVGGGTTHWTGWVPRFTEADFTPRTVMGDIPGASLADWPIRYQDLEPYYDRVEWALGVSGQAGANAYEAPRRRGYPLPPMPTTRYAQKFHEGCAALGYNSYPMPTAMLSAPYEGRRATVQSAFVQQHGDPSGTKSNVLNTFIPDALATGRLDLRPESYVHEIAVDSSGRAHSVVYQDAAGDFYEQEAEVVLVGCGAIESARLLLMSQSGRFPNGLANGSDLVGRNLTLHEYTAAIGVFDDPVYGWAGGGYISAASLELYAHDESRGFAGGCQIAAAGAGVPLPINFATPDKPVWGAEAKAADRELFNHTLAVAVLVHDLPQETNRVELDDAVTDAWGLPVARITNKIHENDLAQARWYVERNAEIVEAAGARSVSLVHADRITGNCSHQHGTARMGHDPATSVLDASCRAHEVENLYVIDGSPFPTGTGLNPTLTIMANAWRIADIVRAGGPKTDTAAQKGHSSA